MDITLNSTGLAIDIAGAILLWKYGLPESVNRDGSMYLMLEQTSEEDIVKGKRYDIMSRLGLFLLILGFIFQLISNLV